MVTPQGFNALLKLVEEPPEHVKFIFATTEPEKVIGTIRSRTHHYPFRLVRRRPCSSTSSSCARRSRSPWRRASCRSSSVPAGARSATPCRCSTSSWPAARTARSPTSVPSPCSATRTRHCSTTSWTRWPSQTPRRLRRGRPRGADRPGPASLRRGPARAPPRPHRGRGDERERCSRAPRDLTGGARHHDAPGRRLRRDGLVAVRRHREPGTHRDDRRDVAATAPRAHDGAHARARGGRHPARGTRARRAARAARRCGGRRRARRAGGDRAVGSGNGPGHGVEGRTGLVARGRPCAAVRPGRDARRFVGAVGLDRAVGLVRAARLDRERCDHAATEHLRRRRGAGWSRRSACSSARRGRVLGRRRAECRVRSVSRSRPGDDRASGSAGSARARRSGERVVHRSGHRGRRRARRAPGGGGGLPTAPDAWPQVVEHVQRARRSAWSVVVTAQVTALRDDVLTLTFPSQQDVASFKEMSDPSTSVSELLRSAIIDVLGLRVKFVARGPGQQRPGGGAGGDGAPQQPGGGPQQASQQQPARTPEPQQTPAASTDQQRRSEPVARSVDDARQEPVAQSEPAAQQRPAAPRPAQQQPAAQQSQQQPPAQQQTAQQQAPQQQQQQPQPAQQQPEPQDRPGSRPPRHPPGP